jgi:epoxide hydrolase-like predicted phosphatase
MIKVCIFDMGGVLIRDFNIAGQLMKFLGHKELSFRDVNPLISSALSLHNRGMIEEEQFWEIYEETIGEKLPPHEGSLLGRFFTPKLDPPTIAVLKNLKQQGMRVVCGTNVIDAHYLIHQQNGDYDIFDKVYPSHLMQISKPDSAFFHYILEAEKVEPKEAFFTDDMEQNVKAANQVGMKAFLYTSADMLVHQLAGFRLEL